MADAGNHDARLACAGAGEHQQRTNRRLNRLHLRGVEPLGNRAGRRCRSAAGCYRGQIGGRIWCRIIGAERAGRG